MVTIGSHAAGQNSGPAVVPPTPTTGAHLGVWLQQFKKGRRHEVQVAWVEADCAEQNLEIGDVITAVNGAAVQDLAQVQDAARPLRVGDSIQWTVRNKGRGRAVSLAAVSQPPADRRPFLVAGKFTGNRHHGEFLAVADPVRQFAGGSMSGKGNGTIEGTFRGSWIPATGQVDLPLTARIHLLFTLEVKGAIRGKMDRTGRGSGVFEGSASVGSEKGAWTCQPVTRPDFAEL